MPQTRQTPGSQGPYNQGQTLKTRVGRYRSFSWHKVLPGAWSLVCWVIHNQQRNSCVYVHMAWQLWKLWGVVVTQSAEEQQKLQNGDLFRNRWVTFLSPPQEGWQTRVPLPFSLPLFVFWMDRGSQNTRQYTMGCLMKEPRMLIS